MIPNHAESTNERNTSAWLSHIADMLGAEACGMLTVRPDGQHSLIAMGHTDEATVAYRDYYSRLDPLSGLLASRPAGRALVFDTTTHPAYVENRELSEDYLRPHGIDHVAAARWCEPDGTQCFIGIQRFRGAAPFSVNTGRELDAFIHHWRISRALPPAESFDPQTAASRRSCDIAAQLRTPLTVVDARAHIVWCNRAALAEQGELWDAIRKTSARSHLDDTLRARIQSLIATTLKTRSESEALIERPDATWFVLVTPLDGQPKVSLLHLSRLGTQPTSTRSRLQKLYHLTPTEADLAVRLANGESPETIAIQRHVSLETVRTQLKLVFRKTGASRQAQLVGWVARIGTG